MNKSFLRAGSVLALSLVSTMGFAASACTQVNLYEEMRQADPAAFAQIKAEADATLNGQGLFWKISHEADPHVSWLFGTMHKSDPRVMDLPNNVHAALYGATTYVGEMDSSTSGFDMGQIIGASPELLFQQNGEMLANSLDAETVSQIDKLMNERGSDFDQINGMQPWFSVTALVLSMCDVEQGGDPNNFLDASLESQARQNGAEIIGLETLRGQIESLNAIDEEFFFNSLEDAAAQHRAGVYDALLQTSTELYLDENVAVMLPLMLHYSDTLAGGKDEAMESFQRELLDLRNQSMVANSLDSLESGSTFIAVGALHLLGETGLVEGLRNEGYLVERVQLERD